VPCSFLSNKNGYVPPHILVNQDHRFTEGGVMFELYHAPGETVDQLILWLPQERALLPADLFYRGLPMLSSPMKPDRPVLSWAESLERMCWFRPKYLVPSHGKPIRGSAVVDSVLRNCAQAIRHVHDQTVKRINAG
jgi:glyoxylase-like metal-dependent hydrolase (beta-lactamase superfamily II)